MENNPDRVAYRNDGDAQERQRQKAQLATEMANWNKVNIARKLWIIRGGIPPNLGDSPADLQSFVEEAIHVAANVASLLRSFSSFDVGAFGTHVHGPIGHSLMVADRLDFLRLAVVVILSVGLSPGVADDLLCLERVNALGDAFAVAVMGLECAHRQQLQYDVRPRSACSAVRLTATSLCISVSSCVLRSGRPLLLFLPQLVRCSTPHPYPILYAFSNVAAAGEALRLVLSSVDTAADRPTKRKVTAPPAGSPGSKGKASLSLPQAYRMFARTGECKWSPCRFLHEPPAASALSPPSPSPPACREEGGGIVAAGGGSRALSLRAVLPAGSNRGGEGGRGAGSVSG